MAEVLGPLTLQNKALPTGVDGARIAQWEMRDGITWEQLSSQVSLALGEANQRLAAKWGWLMSITDEIAMEYPNGGAVTPMTELTDIDNPALLHGTTIGHMLPLNYYGEAIGGTWRYFRDVRSAQVGAAITAIVNRGIWRFEQKLLTRFFSNSEEAIGSAGYSVPFVRGTGGNVDYAPMAYDGEAFTTSHDHFLAYDNDTGPDTFDDMFEGLAETLAEHGHEAPFQALVSRTDVAEISGLTNFVTIVDNAISVIDRGGATSGSGFYARGNRGLSRVGYYQSNLGLVELIGTARLPTHYVGMTKSYGDLDPRNALAVRVHPDGGFGFSIIPKQSDNVKFPIQQVDVDLEFGVGVGMDRTNGGAAFLVNDDTWANPTIT